MKARKLFALTFLRGRCRLRVGSEHSEGPTHGPVIFSSPPPRCSSGACDRGVVSLRACCRAAMLAREELRPRASMTTPPQPTALGLSSCDTRAVLNGFTRLPEHPRVPLPLTCHPRTQQRPATIQEPRSKIAAFPRSESSPSPPRTTAAATTPSPRDRAVPLHPARACPADNRATRCAAPNSCARSPSRIRCPVPPFHGRPRRPKHAHPRAKGPAGRAIMRRVAFCSLSVNVMSFYMKLCS